MPSRAAPGGAGAAQGWIWRDLFRAHGPAYRQTHPLAVPSAARCGPSRAAARPLWAAISEVCDACGAVRIGYNSCRNRHCPQCQTLAKQRWLEARKAELLPVEYFHLVFTLPHELNPLAQGHPRAYLQPPVPGDGRHAPDLRERSSTPRGPTRCHRDPAYVGPEPLPAHPSALHRRPVGRWPTMARAGSDSQSELPLPRARSVEGLPSQVPRPRQAHGAVTSSCRTPLPVSHSPKRSTDAADLCTARPGSSTRSVPSRGPTQALDYLGRYTHRVAISNERILGLEHGTVRFRWKDYAHGNQVKVMTLEAEEFIRRFLLHIVPDGFVRIRHFGLLANRRRAQALSRCRELLHTKAPAISATRETTVEPRSSSTGRDLLQCPACGEGILRVIAPLPPAAPTPQIRDTS